MLTLLAAFACLLPGAARHDLSFPVFGSGAFLNVYGPGDRDRARTNASAHIWYSLAVPLLAQRIGGQQAMRIAVVAHVLDVLVYEAAFHHPRGSPPNAEYNAELRTGLITLLVPALVYLAVDWMVTA